MCGKKGLFCIKMNKRSSLKEQKASFVHFCSMGLNLLLSQNPNLSMTFSLQLYWFSSY